MLIKFIIEIRLCLNLIGYFLIYHLCNVILVIKKKLKNCLSSDKKIFLMTNNFLSFTKLDKNN